MPPKSWTPEAERDLLLAMLSSDGPNDDIQVKPNWGKVTTTMTSWGYTFTKEAMNQRWSKVILKEHRNRLAAANGGAIPATATTTAPKRKQAAANEGDDADGEAKKPKKARRTTAKKAAKNIKAEADDDVDADAEVDQGEDDV